MKKFLFASEYSERVGCGSLPRSLLCLTNWFDILDLALALALAFPLALALALAFTPLASAASSRCLWGLTGATTILEDVFHCRLRWEQVGSQVGTPIASKCMSVYNLDLLLNIFLLVLKGHGTRGSASSWKLLLWTIASCKGLHGHWRWHERIIQNIAFINSKSLLNSISIAGDWLARDPEWPEGWWTVINMPGFEESRQGLDNMVLSDAVDRCVLKPGGPTLLQATFQLLLGRPFSTPTTFHSQLSSLTWQPREYSAGENPNRCLCRTWSFPPTSCILVFPDRRSHWPSRQFPSA